MLPLAHSLCLSVCLSFTCIAVHPLFCSQVSANHTNSFCLQSACHSCDLILNDNISTANSLLTFTPNSSPPHSPLLTPLLPFMTVELPFMTVELPFTSPSIPFPLAGNPSSDVHTLGQDQMMMDAGVALDPSDVGKICCSSTCCHNLTQIPLKCMLVIFFECVLLLQEISACQSSQSGSSQHAMTA